MANSNAQIRVMGGDGNINNIYPQTKIENVDGLKTALEAKGTYSKPSGGIPKTDLSSAVQTSLGKADTALQSFTETDPTVPAWAKASSKPSYTAAEVGAIAASAKGAASGVAELDSNGKVPASQLPSYVDDVLEYSAKSSFPTTGETGKIYVDTSDNKTYRWSGSTYVEISPSLALGTTSSTAYRGDRGNTAYSHATESSRLTTATASGLYKVASTAQGHIASLTAVAKADITALGIPAQDTTYSAATQSANGLMSSTDKTKLDGIATGANKTTVDSSLSSTSTNPVQNKVINTALSGKQATLTFDGTYNASSNKAATVSTVTNALDALDLAEVSVGSIKTIDKISQSNGKVAVSATNIRSASTSQTGIVQLNSTLTSTSTTQAATASTVKLLNDTMTTGTVNRASAIPMGKCDDTSTSTAFTATVEGITELKDGVCVWLTNGVVNSAAGFTININNLGAKPCYSNQSAASQIATVFKTASTVLLVYNSTRVEGGCWDYLLDNNTTYTNVALGQGYGTCTTAASTAAKVVTLSNYALVTGGIVSVKFSYDVPASATMNVNSKGAKAIYHRGAAITAGVIKAGDTATFIYSTYYHLISIDRDDNTSAVTGVKGNAEQTFRTGDVNITPANIGAVALTGNTITGDIQRKQTDIDASKANNNISATKYPTTYSIIDNANRILVRNEAIIESSGNISWYAYVRNYNTSGSQVAQKGIKYTVNKSGTGTWTVDDSANFRSAIGAGTYSKGSDGIPKTDLASAVQTSLGLADSALQNHQTIKQDGVTGATINRFGTCSTAAGTAAKTVSITSGTFTLEAGARVTVKFTYANTANTPTLNVNSKGAKNIYSKGSQITTGSNKSLLAGTVDFIYDGTQWHLIGNYIDTNTDTHRPIQVNGTERLGNNTTALNLTAGGHVRLRVFDDEPNRVHVHNVSWTADTWDIHVKLNDLTWTQIGGGMYYSSNVTPDVGDYVIRHFYGATIVDFDNMAPVFILPCVGSSSPTVWFMSSTGTFPSDAELVIRVFYPINYEDNN